MSLIQKILQDDRRRRRVNALANAFGAYTRLTKHLLRTPRRERLIGVLQREIDPHTKLLAKRLNALRLPVKFTIETDWQPDDDHLRRRLRNDARDGIHCGSSGCAANDAMR